MKLVISTLLAGALFMGACGGSPPPNSGEGSPSLNSGEASSNTTQYPGVTLTVNNLTSDECNVYAAQQTARNPGQVWTASYVDGVCTVQQQL